MRRRLHRALGQAQTRRSGQPWQYHPPRGTRAHGSPPMASRHHASTRDCTSDTTDTKCAHSSPGTTASTSSTLATGHAHGPNHGQPPPRPRPRLRLTQHTSSHRIPAWHGRVSREKHLACRHQTRCLHFVARPHPHISREVLPRRR